MKATKAAWLQAISFGVLALCVLVLTVDVLLVQWRVSQALDDLGRQVQELSQLWGGDKTDPACEWDPVTGDVPEGC